MSRGPYRMMPHEYVVCREGYFLGFSRSAWKEEYPEAQVFRSLPDAVRQARRYSGAVVVRDYGLANQQEVY